MKAIPIAHWTHPSSTVGSDMVCSRAHDPVDSTMNEVSEKPRRMVRGSMYGQSRDLRATDREGALRQEPRCGGNRVIVAEQHKSGAGRQAYDPTNRIHDFVLGIVVGLARQSLSGQLCSFLSLPLTCIWFNLPCCQGPVLLRLSQDCSSVSSIP